MQPPKTINVLDSHARENSSGYRAGHLSIGDSLWRPGHVLKDSTKGELLAWDTKSFFQTNNDVTIAIYRVPGYNYPILLWFDNKTSKRIA